MRGNCWDRAASPYFDLWVPRLIPYHEDLIRRAVPRPGERVLVTAAGPGAELLPISRALDGNGMLAATDSSPTMIEHARSEAQKAGIAMPIDFRVADAADTLGGTWDLIVSAFGLWQLEDRDEVLRSWSEALGEDGRIAVLEWGPPEPDGPFQLAELALVQTAPELGGARRGWALASRESMGELLASSGLRMVRHAVIRNTMSFGSAEGFLQALCSGGAFVHLVEGLGRERLGAMAEAFYAQLDPPSARTPLSFAPAASIAIAQKSPA